MDLRQVVKLVRRWWWLLLLGPLLAGATAYGVSSRQRPMYRASTTLLVNPAQSTATFDSNAVLAGNSLADTYQELVRTWPVLLPVIDELKLPYDVDELRDKVTVSTVQNTRIIDIEVSDADAEGAAVIANAVGERFSRYVAEQAVQVSSPARALIDQQIADTQRRIDELERGDPTLEARAALDQLQRTYAELLLTAQTMDLNTAATESQVTVAVPAVPPPDPYAPRVLLSTLLGLIPSLLITGGAIGVLDYLNGAPSGGLPPSGRALMRTPLPRRGRQQQTGQILSG